MKVQLRYSVLILKTGQESVKKNEGTYFPKHEYFILKCERSISPYIVLFAPPTFDLHDVCVLSRIYTELSNSFTHVECLLP